jgi:hypothetical protein
MFRNIVRHRTFGGPGRSLLPLCLLLGLWCCPACAQDKAAAPAEWTVMVYMDGDNNLEYCAIMDFLEMEHAIPENVEILVLFDRHKGYTDLYGNWTGTRLYRVRRAPPFEQIREAAKGTSNALPPALASEMLEDWGEVDMSDPATLTRFIKTVAERFPAKRYALIPWNHGGGWPGMLQDEDGGEGAPVKSAMTIGQFVKAAKAGAESLPRKRFDLLKFELCLMGQLDVLSSAAEVADYAFASPPEEPGQGSDFLSIMPLFRADLSTEELTKQMVDLNVKYYTELGRPAAFSAYDLSKMRDVTASLRALTSQLIPLTGEHFRELTQGIYKSTHYPEDLSVELRNGKNAVSSVELADWLDGLEQVPGAPKEAIAALRERVKNLAYHAGATPDLRKCRGLTIYLPLRRDDVNPGYRATAFAQESGMDEYLKALYKARDLLGNEEPRISNIEMGAPVLKPGRDGRSAADFDIRPIDFLTPFSRHVMRFDITGVGILMTHLMQFEQRGQDRYLNCIQLLVYSEKREKRKGRPEGGNVLTEISPDYNDGTTTIMREMTVKYKVTNGQTLDTITIENINASREFTGNVSVGSGLYRDSTTGGQDIPVKVTFSNLTHLPIKAVGSQLDAQGNVVGMRGVTLRPDGVFRPAVIVIGPDGKMRREYGQPMHLSGGVLILTVDMLDEGTQVGNIIMVETMNGKKAFAASKTLPVRQDRSLAAMRQHAIQHGGQNLPGRYAMIQFYTSKDGVDPLPTFETLELVPGQPTSRWILRDGDKEKGNGPLNWLPFGQPLLAAHKEPKMKGSIPLGETTEAWYAFLSGTGPERVWYCIETGVGTRWAFVPLEQYQGDPLEGVWVSKTERWEFKNGVVRLTRDGHTGEGSYSIKGHIAAMTGMPAKEYAIYVDKKQGRLTLMSREKRASILTREGGQGGTPQVQAPPQQLTPEQQIGQMLCGSWMSGPETGYARLSIQPVPASPFYLLRLSSQGQGEIVCTFSINVAGGELWATYPNGAQARIRVYLAGNSLTLYFPGMPEIRFMRQ